MNNNDTSQIQNASIYELLKVQRFAPIGDPKFQGKSGELITKRLQELRNLNPEEYVNASKMLGW